MIKNLLWKQAMKLAKKKFGDLNTNEANKWLVDKYNALLGKENTKNIANKIREDLKRDRPFDNFKPEVVPKKSKYVMEVDKRGPGYAGMEHPIKPQKWNPFKKEGKKIDFMDYYAKRKRGEFDEGGMILPQAKPYNFEEKLDFLREIKGGVGSKMYLQMMSDTLSEGVEKGAISKEERDNFLKRFTGTISEDWTSAIDDENLFMYEGDYERYPPKFNKGGFTGSDLYFQDKFNEFDILSRYNLMTPKEGWDQMLQDIKNSDFIKSMKMEEGESGKLPPIPSSILMRLGLGSLIKNMRSVKGLYEAEKKSPLKVSNFHTHVGGSSRRDFLLNLFGKKKKWKKEDLDYLRRLDDAKLNLGTKLDDYFAKFMKSLDDGTSMPKMPKFKIEDSAKNILKKAKDKKTTFHAEGGLAGMLGETQPQTQQVGYAEDRNKIIQELYDKAGGFEGTGKTFSEFMADVLFEGDYLAKGGRVGLKDGGMTPSEKWMRNYYYDGKGGYDTWMSFQEFQMGPGVELWNRHIGKYAEGGRAGYLKGGLLRQGIMEALDFFTRKSSRQGVDVRETILPQDDVGDWAVNFGEVRDLFKNLDKSFAGKITSKESINDIITRLRDTRKLDLSKNIKEFLNNKIKGYKSGLEEIKKYGQRGSIEEVGDHAEELRYLIKETRKDLEAIDKYGLTQQAKKATKHAEGGIISLKNGGAIDTLSDKYKEYSPKGPWTKGLWDMDVVYTLYETLAPFMQLFMKDGGRVSFKEGKGMSRRAFLKLMGAAAALPVVGKFFKLAKPAAKAMDDIKITLRGDGDWEYLDEYWQGGNWVNYSFEALTDKGRKILAKLSKGKNASLVDQGDGIFYPGKVVKHKSHVGGQYLTEEADHAVDAVENIKKAKGKMNLNTRVGKNTKGIDKSQKKYPGESTDSTEHFKTYSSKNINKKNILNEVDDMYAHDWGGYAKKRFDDESVETILDILDTTKKAEGGRVGLELGGTPKSLLLKWLMKQTPKLLNSPGKAADAYLKFLKDVKTKTLKGDYTKALDAGIISGLAALLGNQYKKWAYGTEQGSFGESEYPRYSAGNLYGQNDEYWEQLAKEKFEGIKMGEMDKMSLKEFKEKGGEELWEGDSWIYDYADRYATDKAEGGRIGLDTGGPPIEPYSTSDPEAAAKEITRRYIEMITEPAKVPIDKDIQLMFDLDRAKIGGTKDFLGGEIDFGINKGFGQDDLGYGFNWSKKFSDGGSVLQRPMFYQGGLTKTVPPKKGPMPQGLQSDVYDGIMRPGVINGRN